MRDAVDSYDGLGFVSAAFDLVQDLERLAGIVAAESVGSSNARVDRSVAARFAQLIALRFYGVTNAVPPKSDWFVVLVREAAQRAGLKGRIGDTTVYRQIDHVEEWARERGSIPVRLSDFLRRTDLT